MKKVGFIGNKLEQEQFMEDHLGAHVLIEFYNCSNVIGDIERLESGFIRAAERSGATVVNSNFHQFSPYGVSGVVVIQESHFTIHTWPEHNFAAVDIFTCSLDMSIEIAIEELSQLIDCDKVEVQFFSRGVKSQLNGYK